MTDEPVEEEAPPTPAHRLAQVFTEAWTRAKAAALPDETTARHSAIDDHMDRLEEELRPVLAKALGPYLESGNLPPEWQEILGDGVKETNTFGFLLFIAEFFGAMLAVLPAMGQVLLQPYVNDAWAGAPHKPLSPADAADAVERNINTPFDLAHEAASSGYDNDRFNALVALTGEPPGPIDMLRLWLRGDITEDRLKYAIRYSRIRNEFIPEVEQLAYTQMTPADAIMAAIKEVVTLAEAQALFVRGGGLAADFDTLYQAAGDSIGIQQVLTLWKFGLATEDDVNKALGRSRINPMFYPLAKLTHFHPLSAFQIARAVTAGTITPAQAETWMVQNGVPQDQAHALANAHSGTGTTKVHGETEALIKQAYDDHVLSYADAHAALINIGYTDAVATLILEVADAAYAMKQQGHAVSVIRANYVAHRLTRTAASAELDKLNVPPAARDHWLSDWDIEIESHPKTLTAVQLATAGHDGFLQPDAVYARIQQEGYTAADAKTLMQLHKAPLPAGV